MSVGIEKLILKLKGRSRLGLQIQELARKREITIEDLHKATGIPVTQVRKLYYNSRTGLARDRGTLSSIKVSSLERIAQVLCVKTGELFSQD